MKPRAPRSREQAAESAGRPAIEPKRRIELPELFDPDAARDAREVVAEASEGRCVLLVARSPSLRNFLVPIFKREGCRTVVASTREEVTIALGEHPVDHILVAQDVVEEFSEWIADGKLVAAGAEVSLLATVSGTLLDNPAPYAKMVKAMFAAVQLMNDERVARIGGTAPYALVARDVRDLCRSFGIRRIATDGSQLAAWLLTPAAPGTPAPFRDLARSITHARTLNFPWRVDALLEKTRALYAGEARPGVCDARGHELDIAAQILSLAWYRHAVGTGAPAGAVHGDVTGEADARTVLRGRLRSVAGRLASLEVVEAYIRLAESDGQAADAGERRVVALVSANDDLAREVGSRFGRLGLRVEHKDSMAEARPYCEHTPPAAVLVDFATLGMEAARLSVVLRLIPDLLLYALVDSSDPSVTLDLIDAGFDDVMPPPHDFDVIAARINRAARQARRQAAEAQVGFRGTFAAFSFVDLVQSLSQSRKSVRIDLMRGDGEAAMIYLDSGRIVHARAGVVQGADAVYHVIAWNDDGSFTVEPVQSFPPANVTESTEGILMEGCRLFDESHA